jgi:tetratricopeptide (TPR) repeat protein
MFVGEAGLLIESNNHEAALESLEQAITINPRYTIAYFALYSLCRKLSRPVAAQAYLDIVRNLLLVCPATDLLEDGEGLTVGQLLVILQTLERVGQ